MFKLNRTTAVLVPKLTALETYILGGVLTALGGLIASGALHLSAHTRDALLAAIMLLGAVVPPITPADFLAKIPARIVYLIQAALGVLVIVIHSWNIGSVGVVIITVIIVAATTLGLGPAPAPVVATHHTSGAVKGTQPHAK